MTSGLQQELDDRSRLAGGNRLELLLFRLGVDGSGRREVFGINVFKVREALRMPDITFIPGLAPQVLGVCHIRDQVVPVIDLPAVVGCTAQSLDILIVTEYERSVHGFAVEDVEQITRLDWSRVLSAEVHAVGGMVTSIAQLDARREDSRLALVLDVEKVLRDVLPSRVSEADATRIRPQASIPAGSVILAADDSYVARNQIEQVLKAMGLPYIMTKTGKEAWERLCALGHEAQVDGKPVTDKVALVLSDLEMPEMDGFTLTRRIKEDERLRRVPVVIHSSLTGHANEEHARRVGADGYVTKFAGDELSAALLDALGRPAGGGPS